MPNYFRNLEETLDSQSGAPLTPAKKIRFWINNHLRLVWNLVMMFILLSICLWASYVVSTQHRDGTIIETIAPEVKEAQNVDAKLESAAKSLGK
jgi:cell division protein FtsL